MKRSEKLSSHARQHAMRSIMILVVSATSGVWASTAFLNDGGHPGGWYAVVAVGALALALLGALTAVLLMAEALRLIELSRMEARWEWEREIRPKF
jgi:hypothetical protein